MSTAMAHACLACGREIDPIRAGEVAFVGGRFVYFCDREHKSRWLASVDTSASNEVVTAEPPLVASAALVTEAEPEVDQAARSDEEPRSMPIRRWATSDTQAVSLRAETLGTRPPSSPRWPSTIAYVGVTAGALTLGVSLVGGSAEGLRLPLAVAACACALTYGVAIAGRLLGPAPSIAAMAVAAALVCAVLERTRATHAATASFAGVAAASFIAMCAAMFRSMEPVTALRASILAALDVPAKTTNGVVAALDVRAGEQVNVAAGDTVPVDGVVVSGDAVVSPWLDATTDVAKREGSSVVAGARVLSGALWVTATWTGADRAFAKLLTPKAGAFDVAPLVRLARMLDRRILPLFCALAGGAAFASGATIVEAIACAAAAVTAFGTPIATFAVSLCHARAHLRALQLGIVHRDARLFDRAGRARIAVVCARGTMLLGEPEIVAVEVVGATDANAVIALASAAVMGSPHPFAAAIARAARTRGVRPENVRSPLHAGSGAIAVDAQGGRIVVGRRVFLLAEKVSVAVADELVRDHEAQGRSVLLVSRAGKVVGLVVLQDGLRAGARAAIQRLHDARIEPVLLSGEARETCEAIGRALDIEHLRPEVAGPDRGTEVRALGEGGDLVAVLGHPAADDSALGAADVSVALDAAGSSPGEWAVALASDDVRAAAEALTLPRLARERSIRAMVVAFAPGILASLALAFQLMPPWAAPLVGALSAAIALLYAKE